MDINLVRGVITAIVFFAFIAIWIWAFSRYASKGFEESALLPLNDDQAPRENRE